MILLCSVYVQLLICCSVCLKELGMTTPLVIALFGSNGVFWYYITNAQRKRQAIKIIMFLA